jgi:hypothetical protein
MRCSQPTDGLEHPTLPEPPGRMQSAALAFSGVGPVCYFPASRIRVAGIGSPPAVATRCLMSAAPESVDPAVPRPSRQDLVLPPRSSSWPVAAGVVASAAAGFGLVFFLGIGRSRPLDDRTAPHAAAVATSAQPASSDSAAAQPAGDEPAFLPRGETAPDAPSDRWSPRGEADREAVDLAGDRYATRPVSHDASPPMEPAAAPPPRAMSRFSSPDLPPAAAAPPAASDPLPDDAAAAEPDDTPSPPVTTSVRSGNRFIPAPTAPLGA